MFPHRPSAVGREKFLEKFLVANPIFGSRPVWTVHFQVVLDAFTQLSSCVGRTLVAVSRGEQPFRGSEWLLRFIFLGWVVGKEWPGGRLSLTGGTRQSTIAAVRKLLKKTKQRVVVSSVI